MTPELRDTVRADNSMDRVTAAPTATEAYEALQAEVSKNMSTPGDNSRYWQNLKSVVNPRLDDLALGFANARFADLDRDGDGKLQLAEISPSQGKTELERLMLASLTRHFNDLKHQTRTGAFWSLYQMDPNAITGEDLKSALTYADIRQKASTTPPILPNWKPGTGTAGDTIDSNENVPPSVRELLQARGITIKSVPGRLGSALKDYAEEAPIVSVASAIYNAGSKEIITERFESAQEAKQHEIGHAIDDAMAPGEKYFSDSKEFNTAVDRDMSSIRALSAAKQIDWLRELPTVHVFIQGQLSSGELRPSGRRELFAELYQNRDTKLVNQLRAYFPHTASAIDSKLAAEGLERFSK